jgi:hypothetical protein
MAEYYVIKWQDIPAQIIVKYGRKTLKKHLGEKYEQAIDRAAMRQGLKDSNSYLEQWIKEGPFACNDNIETEIDIIAEKIIAEYESKIKN